MKLFGRYKKAYEMIEPNKDDFILDIGSSSGFLTKKLPCRVIGIDIDKEKIKRANKNLPSKKTFLIANGTNLPFKDEIFSKVVVLETLEHVTSPLLLVKEIYRNLKPKGRLIISVPHKGVMGYLDLGGWLCNHKHYSYEELRKFLNLYFFIEEKFVGGFIWNLIDLYFYATKYSLLRVLKFVREPSDIIATPKWLRKKMNREFEKENKNGFILFIKARKVQKKRKPRLSFTSLNIRHRYEE